MNVRCLVLSVLRVSAVAFSPGAGLATVLDSRATPRVQTIIFPSPPPLIRFIGTLGPGGENASGLRTLTVMTDHAMWRFTLRDVVTLTSTGNPDWMMLDDIFPLRLHFMGSAVLLRAVDTTARAGTPTGVSGRHSTSNGTFLVTEVSLVEQPTEILFLRSGRCA